MEASSTLLPEHIKMDVDVSEDGTETESIHIEESFKCENDDSGQSVEKKAKTIACSGDRKGSLLSEGGDGTKWSDTPASETVSQPGPVLMSKLPDTGSLKDPLTALQLFVSEAMVTKIVAHTNEHGRRTVGDEWKDCDQDEIWALLGCFILTGALKRSRQSIEYLFHEFYGIKMLQACFSPSRFTCLTRHLCFTDKTASKSFASENDCFAPIRDVWNLFNQSLASHYVPGSKLTMGSQFILCKGKCPFLVSQTSTKKHGIQVFWLCDSDTGFPLQGIPYLCTRRNPRRRRPNAKVVQDMLLKLTSPFADSARNVTVKGWAIDLSVANQLLERGITVLGLAKTCASFLPQGFADANFLEPGQSMFGFQNNSTLCSYKENSDRHIVLVSTRQEDMSTASSSGTSQKPKMAASYDKDKVAVDRMKKATSSLTCRRSTKRWPLVVFYNMLDVASWAALVIYTEKFPNSDKFSVKKRVPFQLALAESLVSPHLGRRNSRDFMGSTFVKGTIKECVDFIQRGQIPDTSGPVQRSLSSLPLMVRTDKRRRCAECAWKTDKKSNLQCSNCSKILCQDHTEVICAPCYKYTSCSQ